MGRKDGTIKEMSRRHDLNATVKSLTGKVKSVSNELGMALDKMKQKGNDFREMQDDRNNIASIKRVLQSTIEELREENAGLREEVNGRSIFDRIRENNNMTTILPLPWAKVFSSPAEKDLLEGISAVSLKAWVTM